jgi:hypothetical protein
MRAIDPAAGTRKCWHSVGVVVVVLAVSLIILKWHQKLPLLFSFRNESLPIEMSIDSEMYLEMATHGPSQIASPFSKRFLCPWLVGTISRATGQAVPSVFMALNLVSFLGLAFCLAEILRVTVGKPLLALLFLLTPIALESFELAYLPDMFHMALVAAFFLFLLRQKVRCALFVLFVAFLARESTLVLCFFAAILAWFRSDKRLAFGAGGVLCAGTVASSLFTRLGKPNIHHLPDFVYLLGKVGYYLLLNFTGFRIWSSVRPEEGQPFVVWHLPSWLKIGADTAVGIAYPNWHYPTSTAVYWLTVFGLGPLILFKLVRRFGKVSTLPFAIELALIYGAASFLIGPLLGDSVDRLVGYGWPAFWIAMPYLMYACGLPLKDSQLTLLTVGYSIACWWPRLLGYGARGGNPWPSMGVLVFYFLAIALLKNIKKDTDTATA